jgi:catechol 2,3-dioxygenase-like lactoylglutathione lyase family enzyme
MASVIGLHHVQLAMPPGGEADAQRFYGGLLGLERVEKPKELASRGGCWFRGPGVEFHLGIEEDFRPARKAHPAFLIDGLADLRRRLAAAGVQTAEDVQLEGQRRFYAYDPFGNRVELVELA